MNNLGSSLGLWQNKWALVTGAGSGIGKALAEELAALGAKLVLTGRRLDRLESLAVELRRLHRSEVHVVQADLGDPSEVEKVFAFTEERNLEIEILVNNAGLLRYGPFVTSDLKTQLQMVQVHCLANLHLSRLYLPGMVQRRSGSMLIVATTTLVPAPYLTTYAATKGFQLLFAEGLREEVAQYGVNVSALCAGPTQSELHGEGTSSGEKNYKALQPAKEVAQRALAGLAAGKPRIHPSRSALLLALLPRLLPRSTVSGGAERIYRPGS